MIFRWARHPGSAPIARDRLKILLAHERTLNSRPDLLARVHSDIVAVICRHVTVSPEQVQVKMDRVETVSRLTIDIEVPASTAVPTSGEGIKGFGDLASCVLARSFARRMQHLPGHLGGSIAVRAAVIYENTLPAGENARATAGGLAERFVVATGTAGCGERNDSEPAIFF